MPDDAPADEDTYAFYGLLRCPLCPERPALIAQEKRRWRCAPKIHTFDHKDGFLALRPGDELLSENSS
jgi:hypothetical protein